MIRLLKKMNLQFFLVLALGLTCLDCEEAGAGDCVPRVGSGEKTFQLYCCEKGASPPSTTTCPSPSGMISYGNPQNLCAGMTSPFEGYVFKCFLPKYYEDATDKGQKGKGEQKKETDYEAQEKKDLSGECSASEIKSLKCSGFLTLSKTAQASNAVTQIGGQIVTQAAGMQAQYNTYSSGTTKAALEGSATTMETTSYTQMAAGGTNESFGILQAGSSMQITRQIAQLKTEKKTLNDEIQRLSQAQATAGGGLTLSGLTDSERIAAAKEKLRVVEKAEIEQRALREKMQASAASSIIQGSTQMMQGGLNFAAAQKLKAAANQLSTTTNASTIQTPTLDNPAGSAQTAATSTSITGDGTGTTSAASDTSQTSSPLPDLGNGFGTTPLPSGIPSGPPTSAQNPVAQPNPAAGGPTVDTAGGTSAANGGPTEDPQAKLASKDGGIGYSSGGTFTGGGGGGGAAKSGDTSDSALAALLDKFKPKEDPALNQNGIAIYGKTADADAPYSPLSKTTNIFESVSETYIQRTKSGTVGITGAQKN